MHTTSGKVFKYDDPAPGAWTAFIDAMRYGETIEIDEDMYFYWLEVLPPVFMDKPISFPDKNHPIRYDFGFAEGAEPITLFWRSPDRQRFFCRRSDIMNPRAFG